MDTHPPRNEVSANLSSCGYYPGPFFPVFCKLTEDFCIITSMRYTCPQYDNTVTFYHRAALKKKHIHSQTSCVKVKKECGNDKWRKSISSEGEQQGAQCAPIVRKCKGLTIIHHAANLVCYWHPHSICCHFIVSSHCHRAFTLSATCQQDAVVVGHDFR